jgi:hypothetical protein
MRVEASFFLDFLGTFCIKTKGAKSNEAKQVAYQNELNKDNGYNKKHRKERKITIL